MTIEQALPASPEAEASVLGGILIDPNALERVADKLVPDDFSRVPHQHIFRAMLDLFSRGQPADIITVSDELARNNRLDAAGGDAYVTSLLSAAPTSFHIEFYAGIVERQSVMNRLIKAAGRIAQIGYEARLEPQKAIDEAELVPFQVARNTRGEFRSLRELLEEYFRELDKLSHDQGGIVGLPTGFSALDTITGGLQPSDLIVLAARPSVGKTALALSIAHATATRHQNTVAFFSLEMLAMQLAQRLISMEAKVDAQRLRTGWIHNAEWGQMMDAIAALSEANIFFDDTPAISVAELRSKARRLHAQHPVGLIIVDYLQLMSGGAEARKTTACRWSARYRAD